MSPCSVTIVLLVLCVCLNLKRNTSLPLDLMGEVEIVWDIDEMATARVQQLVRLAKDESS